MELSALIFDVDGTLADTEQEGHRPAFNTAFAEAGLDWHWHEALYSDLLSVGGGKERIIHYARQLDPAFLARPDAEARIAQLHAAKTRHYSQLLQRGAIPLRPGVRELIYAAHGAGLRLAIATTSHEQGVLALLHQHLGREGTRLFSVIAAGDVVQAKKPAPDIYRYVLAQLGLKAQACVAIEDSASGLAAAQGADIATLITPLGSPQGDDFDAALAVLPDLSHMRLETLRQLHRAQNFVQQSRKKPYLRPEKRPIGLRDYARLEYV